MNNFEDIKLPEPDTHCFDDDTGKDLWSHSTDQMREYGRLCRAAGIEEAAEVCDDLHYTWKWDDEPDSDSGPRSCAKGIRALGKTGAA